MAKRTGIIFRAGDYGSRGNFTAKDLDHAAMESCNLPVNLSHQTSVFDGKLGHLTRVLAAYDDTGCRVLRGEWEEPDWLSQLLGDTPRKCSAEFALPEKKLIGLALTMNPQIPDAALFSAVQSAYACFSAGQPVHTVNFANEPSLDPAVMACFSTNEQKILTDARLHRERRAAALQAYGMEPEVEEALIMSDTGRSRIDQIVKEFKC